MKVGHLIAQLKSFEKESEKLKSDISILASEKASSEKATQQLLKTIQENKETISQLKVKMKTYEREIERLRNIKWYQILFSQK